MGTSVESDRAVMPLPNCVTCRVRTGARAAWLHQVTEQLSSVVCKMGLMRAPAEVAGRIKRKRPLHSRLAAGTMRHSPKCLAGCWGHRRPTLSLNLSGRQDLPGGLESLAPPPPRRARPMPPHPTRLGALDGSLSLSRPLSSFVREGGSCQRQSLRSALPVLAA